MSNELIVKTNEIDAIWLDLELLKLAPSNTNTEELRQMSRIGYQDGMGRGCGEYYCKSCFKQLEQQGSKIKLCRCLIKIY